MLGRAVGRYHVVAKLGEGGMGTVWKAEDTVLRRTVALKFLPEDLANDVGARRRFLRGATATAALRHPHIATLYEISEHEGEYFLVADCIDGESLADALSRGPLLERDAVRIAAEVAEALAHAHDRGVVHRDVTSRNVMLRPDGSAVVIDFGLALQAGTSRITSSGATIGTLSYMAPEVLQGERADHRADIYGLGVVTYEMLTGVLPFASELPGAIVYGALHEDPTPPSTRRPALSQSLDGLVLRAMARDRSQRFPTAQALAVALRDVLREDSVAAAPDSHAEPTTPSEPSADRRPATAPRVAIMPFRAMGEAPDDDAVGAGLSEAIVSTLGTVAGVHVMAAVPSRGVAKEDGELLAAARRAGAATLLTGLIRSERERIRVSYRLVEVHSGALLASDTVEGTAEEAFRIEDQLVKSMLDAVSLTVPPPRAAARLEGSESHGELLKALGYLKRTDDEPSVDSAIRILEDLLEREGETAIVQAVLGKAYLHKFGLSKVPLWIRRAETACRRALTQDPHSAEVLVTLGRVQIATGSYSDAVRSFEQSLELRPDGPEALQHLSSALERRGQYDEAIESAKRAIALRPEFWGAHHRLGAIFFRLGRCEEAAAAWERVVELTPDNKEGLLNLGAACFELGRLDDAADWFRRSLAIAETASACTGLGTVLFYTGRRVEAKPWFERGAELSPQDANMWANLGDASRWIEGLAAESHSAFDQAIHILRRHLELNPVDAEAWSLLAKCLAKLGKAEESLQAIRRALSLAPDLATSLSRSVTVFHLAGRRQEAIESWHRAMERGCSRKALEGDPELESLWKDVVAGS